LHVEPSSDIQPNIRLFPEDKLLHEFNAGLGIPHPNNNNNLVPSTDAVNTFLKSFDSATSMVFHGRTGLPRRRTTSRGAFRATKQFAFRIWRCCHKI
jgi:hypothetical protein